MTEFRNIIAKYEWAVITLLFICFILVRLPGVHSPLHQDEYKWLGVGDPSIVGLIPHPPLGEVIYKTGGDIVGFNTNFRFIPLFFGALNLLLLYYLVRSLFGRQEALVASIIWIFSYYSVLASLMVDTDGAIMPFFFLVSLIAYFKLQSPIAKNKVIWGVILILGLLGGMMIKVSFVLSLGAILADFLWSKKNSLDRKLVMKYTEYAIGAIIFFVVLLYVSRLIFPFFDLKKSFVYWEHFFTLNRGWFQTFIQCVKAGLYSSPLLLVPIIGWKEIKDRISKTRVFLFFLLFAFIFYIILFDFSIGALDRYLELLVLPLAVLSSVVLVKIFRDSNHRVREFIYLGLAASLILVLFQSLPHSVPSLYPKSEWINRILSFKWNFLYPFSGGSGPLGFYISFFFIGVSWILSIGSLILAFVRPEMKKLTLAFILPIAIFYNFVFIEEYLVGFWNGSAPQLVYHATEFIKNNPNIGSNSVIVYNDNGAREIQETGKYLHRLYTAPYFVGYDLYLNDHKTYNFVLDVPRIDPKSFFVKYFAGCKSIFSETDKYMSAVVYDCRKAPSLPTN